MQVWLQLLTSPWHSSYYCANAAFISLVILRYYRQLSKDKTEEEPASAETDVQPQRQTAVQEQEQEQEIEPQKVLVVADGK